MSRQREALAEAASMALLPPGTPILARPKRAAELFDISERQLANLKGMNPDFPAFKIGGALLYDIPRCYAWFGDHIDSGEAIEVR